MTIVNGSCLCGEVTFRLKEDPSNIGHCHCSMCRKSHGSSFATYGTVSLDNFEWTGNNDLLDHFESSAGFSRAFCRQCGSSLPSTEDLMVIPVGTLIDPIATRPSSHVFVSSKAPWYEITDELTQHASYPGAAADAGHKGPDRDSHSFASGSCLCNDVQFSLSGPPLVMINCHCSRCRRSRAAAHATNSFLQRDNFEWRRGADQVVDYQLPNTKRFGVSFCAKCGSLVPRDIAGRDTILIPSGCFDADPKSRPNFHIYVGSKANWYEITDDLVSYEESRS